MRLPHYHRENNSAKTLLYPEPIATNSQDALREHKRHSFPQWKGKEARAKP